MRLSTTAVHSGDRKPPGEQAADVRLGESSGRIALQGGQAIQLGRAHDQKLR
jgi:hypothetical protein